MAVSVTCTSVRSVNGRVLVRWSDKTENEFASVAEATRYVRDILDKDVLRAIAISKALTNDPTGAGAAAYLTGKTVTVDLTLAANLVRIT